MVGSLVGAGTDGLKQQVKRVLRPLAGPVAGVHRVLHARLDAGHSTATGGAAPSSQLSALAGQISELESQLSALRQSLSDQSPLAPPLAGDLRGQAVAAVSRLLQDPVVVIDIGCRWGFADVWSDMGDRAITIGFDPDVEECARLREHYGDRPGVQVVPVGLGSQAGRATLHVTEDPGGSSLLPPADDAVDNHPGVTEGRVVKTQPVELTTLDEWSRSEGRRTADFIKLDTQGTELDILRGGEELLRTVRAIEVEVEFNALYDGVPLFGDLDGYLRSQGFVLWRLDNLAHYAQWGASRDVVVRNSQHVSFGPHDVESVDFGSHVGQLYWADAYFVRREVARPSADLGWEQLVRDACLTAALNFFDLSAIALRKAHATAPPEVTPSIEAALAAVPGS